MTGSYAVGRKAFGFCDICGFRYPLGELKYFVFALRNTRVKACPVCLDKDHPQLQVGRYPVVDPQALIEPRPDQSLYTPVPTYSARDLFSWNPVGANIWPMQSSVGQVTASVH